MDASRIDEAHGAGTGRPTDQDQQSLKPDKEESMASRRDTASSGSDSQIHGLRVRAGVVGCGYWGPHLIRNLHDMPEVELVGVAEQRPDRRQYVRRSYPAVRPFSDHRQLLESEADAIVIATPIHTHFELASQALLAGKHVLVEKPLARSTAEAAELVRLARRQQRVLMVGHTFLYNPAVRELRRIVQEGELGRIYYADAARLNLGLFQRNANVIWDLAPHDISILMYLLAQVPVMVSAQGSSHVQSDVHDVCYLELVFPHGVTAHVHVSWLDPDKVRRLTLVGDRRMAVYDDMSAVAKLRVYDSGVEYPAMDNYGGFELAYRHGQIVIPYIKWREPLRVECEHFVHCVRTGEPSLSDGQQGLDVVATLEAADRSLRNGGTRVLVEPSGRSVAWPRQAEPHVQGNGQAAYR
jgi:predicted dehydrogenase